MALDVILFTLIATHITIVCVTVFLHRGQAHRGLTFHPVLGHFMRFWLWLTTGMTTKEWVAVHRKHHAFTEQSEDPHSPHVYGIWRVLFGGALLYSQAARDRDMVEKFGVGTPDDWLERNVYTPYNFHGIVVMLLIDFALFGPMGFIVWGIQMLWIPFWAAGVINGVAHYVGYRNGETRDASRNLVPWGIVVGGEELHNNHHLDPANVKLSKRWFEFDIGYLWIRLFKLLGLVQLTR